jgi:uncharacterized membrane protein
MPEEVFNWDILTMIGASLLILYPFRNLSSGRILAVILFIIALSPLLRTYSNYYSYWNQWGEYVPSTRLKDVLLGFVLNGYFPLLPWLAFPFGGYLVGRICFGEPLPKLPRGLLPAAIGLVLVSLGMIAVASLSGLTGLVSDYLGPLTFYPASTSYVLLTMGVCLLLFIFFFHRYDLPGKEPGDSAFLTFCRRYSRYALTAYILHHAVQVWPLLAAASLTGKRDKWFYYGEVMPTIYALILAAIFIVLFYFLIVAWDKREGHYSFEWLLRRLTG